MSTMAAGALALLYSRELGIENRAIIGFVLTTAVTLLLVFSAGFALTFRQLAGQPNYQEHEISLVAFLSLIASTLASIFMAISLSFYSQYKSQIPAHLFYAAIIYSFFACVDYSCFNILVGINRIRTAGILEFSSILVQIFLYFFLSRNHLFSFAMSLLIAIISAYALTFLVTFKIIAKKLSLSDLQNKNLRREFYLLGRHNYYYTLISGLTDKSDKLIIAWLLPLAIFSKYSVLAGLIAYLRFLPDGMATLLVASKKLPFFALINNFQKITLLFGLIFYGSMGIGSYHFVRLWFGNTWSLPIEIALLLAFQELLRAIYQLTTNQLIRLGANLENSKVSSLFLASNLSFTLLGARFFNLRGIILGQICSYLTAIYITRKLLQKVHLGD